MSKTRLNTHTFRCLKHVCLYLGIWLSCMSYLSVKAQEPLLAFDEELYLKSYWQEYMPDAYTLNDSTILMVGLGVNMSTLTMNFFIRKMTTAGNILFEKEIPIYPNPEGYSFALSTFYGGSTIDSHSVYVISHAPYDSCGIAGDMVRAHRLVKIRLSDGTLERDTLLCFNGIRGFSEINTSAGEDSLYLYGSMGYLNQFPDIILMTLTKDFAFAKEIKLRTVDTHILPLGAQGSSRTVAGSHYRHRRYQMPNSQDIWYGSIVGDTIIEDFRMEYFESHSLYKSFVPDQDEIALIGFSEGSAYYHESVLYLVRNDTLAWNFYNTFYQEISDVVKVGEGYCVIQSSFVEDDDRKDKVVLHTLDHDGFPVRKDAFVTPWIQFAMSGLRAGDAYYVFVYIEDYDELHRVANGEIPLVEGKFGYTHMLKFQINE